MPVAARVVRDLRMVAGRVLATRDISAERRRATALDRTHHLQLVEAHMPAVGVAPSRSVIAENVRDLQSLVEPRLTSSGLSTGGSFCGSLMCQTSAARSWRRSVTRNKNRTPVMIRLRLQMLTPLSMRCSWKRRTSSGVAVSGERFSQAANRLQLEMWPR